MSQCLLCIKFVLHPNIISQCPQSLKTENMLKKPAASELLSLMDDDSGGQEEEK
jgi:hypothetical protein